MKRQTRWAGLLATAATIWVLGPAARTLAQAQEAAAAGLAAQAVHVVEPAQPPSIGAVVRELPLDVWRFVSLDTAVDWLPEAERRPWPWHPSLAAGRVELTATLVPARQ